MQKKHLQFLIIQPFGFMEKFKNQKLIFIIILIIASILRFVGIDWDQNNHLHPDERFLTMVGTAIHLPSSVGDFFQTQKNPLNPYNYQDFNFFVYGTLPLWLVKILAVYLHYDSYQTFNLFGRIVSGFFDLLSLFLVYKIANQLQKGLGILSSLFYAFSVLPIQLSHFFAVDTFLNFFLLGTFYFLSQKRSIVAAIFYSLALSCKVSGIIFLPVIFIFLVKNSTFVIKKTITNFLVFGFIVGLFLRLFQPHLFVGAYNLNPEFTKSIKTLSSFNNSSGWFPPAVQWISKTKLLFPLKNIIFWGLGLPFSVFLILGIIKIRLKFSFIVMLFWIVLLLVYQGTQFSYTMRYFLPIYPYLSIYAAFGFTCLHSRLKYPVLGLGIIFTICFLNIYLQPHSRVQSSIWIDKNIPEQSVLSYEYWDDLLPLQLPDQQRTYNFIKLQLFNQETPQKWLQINQDLNKVDYLILSSNRLWASIPTVPNLYPQTSVFYQKLFDQQLPFRLVYRQTVYPGIQLPINRCLYFGISNYPYHYQKNSWFDIDNCNHPGIYLRDDTAEEAFTVYDHPQVLIFKNESHIL